MINYLQLPFNVVEIKREFLGVHTVLVFKMFDVLVAGALLPVQRPEFVTYLLPELEVQKFVFCQF